MQFTYDSLSRIATEIQGPNPLGSSGKTVSFTYDAEGNRTKIDYPDGFGGSAFDANEARDALGRLTQITDGSAATIASFDLYGAGARKKKTTLANSTTANYAWDGFRRPTDIDHKDSGGTRFAGFAYAWDKSDNPLMEARSHKSGKGDVYTYDRANRLTKVLRDVDDPAAELASPGTEIYDKKLEYAMDDVLNLTSYAVTPYGGSATTTSYTTNAMNEYTAIGGTSPTYTDNGALASDGTYTYTYDGHDRLIEVKQGTTTVATYAYDALGLGRRTKKTVGSAVTKYVYAGQQSIEETDGSGTLLRLFVFGDRIDEILAMDAPDQADVDGDSNTSEVLRFSYHAQLIGSVTHVTAPSGALAEQYEYDPYGKVTIKSGSGSTLSASAIGNAYTFTARQLDEETGLYYYRARMYSAELRRFIQRDPLEYVDGPNALGYCRGRATRSNDPHGLQDSETEEAGGSSGSESEADCVSSVASDVVDGALDVAGFVASLPQNALGLIVGGLFDLFGGEPVEDDASTGCGGGVVLEGGGGGAITIGETTIYFGSSPDTPLPGGLTLKEHEGGHTLQSRDMGPFWWPFVAIPSIITATLDVLGVGNHEETAHEVDADERAHEAKEAK